MAPSGSSQHAQLPWIKEIIQREVWFLGERRGCAVDEEDPEVQVIVSNIIISGAGRYFRQKLEEFGNLD